MNKLEEGRGTKRDKRSHEDRRAEGKEAEGDIEGRGEGRETRQRGEKGEGD